ncbi:siderophore-interacting protein [Ensifer sp. 4252]|uniref:siderophore-interacting protein n=1 Tax=Ensifer sp. 4252 TaxID=3373915 RepID=UPI003D1BBE09
MYHEDYFFSRVRTAERLTPSMIRVVLEVEGADRLVETGHADEWIRLAFAPDDETPVSLPVLSNGKWGRPDGSKACPNRPYTIRHWDRERAEMVVDLVVHEGGVGATWALAAKPGDMVGLCNPEGRYRLPVDARWIVLLCDITGLPAAARILEELPAGIAAKVHVELPDMADRQALTSQADIIAFWYDSFGKHGRASRLDEIARDIRLPGGPGYIWIAGEATCVSESRKHFRDALGFDKQRITAVGYWILGQARV